MSNCPLDFYYQCRNGDCFPRAEVTECNGISECPDGSDEQLSFCPQSAIAKIAQSQVAPLASLTADQSLDPTMTIVLPTIAACILLVFFMILGIQKCNEWELDRIATLRRTRRLMERITVVLREKNIRLIQRAYKIRHQTNCNNNPVATQSKGAPPPLYETNIPGATGISPPPSYDQIALDSLYHEQMQLTAADPLLPRRKIKT